jgi:hypothetical protein
MWHLEQSVKQFHATFPQFYDARVCVDIQPVEAVRRDPLGELVIR